MSYLVQFYTNAVADTSLDTPIPVGEFTNTEEYVAKFYINVFADNVKGNGDYIALAFIQRGGAGSHYECVRTVKTADADTYSICFNSIPVTLNPNDVLTVSLIGTAADNDDSATVIMDVNEEYIDVDAITAGVARLNSALVVEEGTVDDDSPTSTEFKTTLTDVITFYGVLTFTDGTLIHQSVMVEYDWDSENSVGIVSPISDDLSGAPTTGDHFYILPLAVQEIDNYCSINDILGAMWNSLSDSVAGDGDMPTLTQAVYMIFSFLMEKSITGTTMTVFKPDGVTPLMHFTLDSPTAPTSVTRDESS
jgi:hypothetical protein